MILNKSTFTDEGASLDRQSNINHWYKNMKIEIRSNGRVKEGTEMTTKPEIVAETLAEVTETPKKRHSQNNKAVEFRLDIDAGAKRVKCRLNDVFKSFNVNIE